MVILLQRWYNTNNMIGLSLSRKDVAYEKDFEFKVV